MGLSSLHTATRTASAAFAAATAAADAAFCASAAALSAESVSTLTYGKYEVKELVRGGARDAISCSVVVTMTGQICGPHPFLVRLRPGLQLCRAVLQAEGVRCSLRQAVWSRLRSRLRPLGKRQRVRSYPLERVVPCSVVSEYHRRAEVSPAWPPSGLLPAPLPGRWLTPSQHPPCLGRQRQTSARARPRPAF